MPITLASLPQEFFLLLLVYGLFRYLTRSNGGRKQPEATRHGSTGLNIEVSSPGRRLH
jgi:hypothetical protein